MKNMTPEDIDNMQAGRELDTLIHEQVMRQCAHVLAKTERRTEGRQVYKCSKCNADGFHYVTDYAGRIVGVLDYSTDIKAAWQVERFEQDTRQLVAKYVEQNNRHLRRIRRIFNAIIVANVLVAVVVPIILWLFG